MCIHRTTPTRAFPEFPNALLRDRSTSWRAVGVLAYPPSLPNEARVTIRTLAERRGEGRVRIAVIRRELEEPRSLRRVVRRGSRAGQLPVLHEVFDAPCEVEPPTGETEKVPDRPAPRRLTVRAAHLLLSLGRIDSRFTLDAAEALRLAPLVEGWWERGVSDAEVRAAVVYGGSLPVGPAWAHIEHRLRQQPPMASTRLLMTPVEVEEQGPGAFAWRELVRRGGELVRSLVKRRAALA